MVETHEAYAKAVKLSPGVRDALLDAVICTSTRWFQRIRATISVDRERKKLYAEQAYDFTVTSRHSASRETTAESLLP
jgi:hypothetical protein